MIRDKRLLKHSAYTTLERFLKILLTLGSFIVIARSLTTIEFGIYSYIFSIYQIFSIISVFGMDSYLISTIAKNISQVNKIFSESFISSFYASLLAISLFLLASFMSGLGESYHMPIIALGLSYLFNPLLLFNYLNQFLLDARKNFLFYSITGVIFFVIRVYFNKELAVEGFLYTLALENVVYSVSLLILQRNPKIAIRFFRTTIGWKDIFVNCIPLVLSAFLVLGLSRLDQLFLKWYGYNAEVGYASIATRLFEGMYFFPLSISVALFPNLAEKAKDKNIFLDALSLMTLYFVIYAVICILLYFVVGRHFIPLFFGIKYRNALQYLDVKIFSFLFVVFGMVFSRICTINSSNQVSLFVNAIALVINVVLTFVLVRIMGPIAVAYSIAITYFFSGVLLWYMFPNTRFYFVEIFRRLPTTGMNLLRRVAAKLNT